MMHLIGNCPKDSAPEDKKEYFEKDFIKAKKYFDNAFPLLQLSAESGDPESQTDLGYMFYNGHTPSGSDFQVAIDYYSKASEKGYSRALCNLGYIYYNTPVKGVCGDKKIAMEYYQRAAFSGSLVAHSNLGFIYKEKNTMQDLKLAIKHFFIAAKGNEKAREHLSQVFDGKFGDTYKYAALEYLSINWPDEHHVINTKCQQAISVMYILSMNRLIEILPELVIVITKILIQIWPEPHVRIEAYK